MQSALNMEVTIRQSDFRAIEAAILKNKAYEELGKLADLAKKNYPKAMLADYQRGMMYEKMGNYKKALEHAKLALAQAPDDLNKKTLEAAIKMLSEGKAL